MSQLKLSPPWVTFFKEAKALFSQDPQIKPVFDQEEMVIRIYTDNAPKAEALMELLPTEKVFGNVTVKINIIPSNKTGDKYADALKTAFDGNPALREIRAVSCPLGDFVYVVWQKKVVQFFDDNLADVNGNRSTLYEAIARDVLIQQPGVFHCTESLALTAPLGEWP